MAVKWIDLLHAFELASFGQPGENQAVLCRHTGEIVMHSAHFDDDEEWEEKLADVKDPLTIPHKRDLDLGQRLIFRFARQFLPDQLDEVRDIFRRRGAYARFRALLARRNALDRWYAFEKEATEQALREWCAENEVDLDEGDDPAGPAAERG